MASHQQIALATRGAAIPGPRGVPWLGNYPRYRRDPLSFYTGLARRYGDASTFRVFGLTNVFINSPRLIQSFLVDHAQDYDKGKIQRRLFQPLVGNGLLNSEGAFHHRQRKLMAPAFQPRHLSGYADTMVAFAGRRQAAWRDGATIDVHAEMMRLTMEIVARVLLGADVSGDADELSAAITVAVRWFQSATTGRLPLPLNVPTPANLKTQRAIALIKRRIQGIIAAHRAGQRGESGDLLTMLLTAQDDEARGMSNRQLLDEVLTFFLAGHETTALALSWAFYLLMQHPDAYARVQAEADAVLGSHVPTYADLARLPYALQVLKEALRLYPPSSAIWRVSVRDTSLDDRYPIPAGRGVIFSQYVLHRRPDIFPDPERFDPDRFQPENEQKLPRYAYLPFGAGHRICIGNHFAMMEGHLLLATIARAVSFEPIEPFSSVKPELVLTLRPSGPIWARVRRR